MHVIAEGNYIQGTDPFGLSRRIHSALTRIHSAFTKDSVIPAIIIKRHGLLEYRYDASAIYNSTLVLNTRGELELVPSIDQL